MSFLDEVRTKRRKLADVLVDDDYSGIREIVEELYPDKAHFIYELLQNAEDVGAKEAVFTLHNDSLIFEHDGTPFSEENVWGITNIGKGTKRNDDEKIGRFGVGFKAVFAYTETPRIWSPTFSFEISDLVLPSEIPTTPNLGSNTRFEFPFNNPKKSPQDARSEVLAGLSELAETTLLFLTHLECIRWEVGKTTGKVLRLLHTENHIEVLKQIDGKTTSAYHFLRFSQPVRGIEKQRVSVAFVLDQLRIFTAFDPKLPLMKQFRIVPANPGRVSVFFPAEKETSKLRFHLHAPFVPELSRASIKNTPVNAPLFKQLAELSASSLHIIRELGLLSGEFLAVLPNLDDGISEQYEPIRATIIKEMNNTPLTPTYAKSHAPAKYLLQAEAALKECLSIKDVEFLVDAAAGPLQWAIGASERNSDADRFLSGLAIRRWDMSAFLKVLRLKSSGEVADFPEPPWRVTVPDPGFMNWLAAKSVEWHQQFYALLYQELHLSPDWNRLKSLKIVLLANRSYSMGKNCFFPMDDVKGDEILPRVEKAVYSSGKNKPQQLAARKLLEEIGVRELGELEQVQAILNQRYTSSALSVNPADLKRFMELVEKDSSYAKIFADYYIFEREDGSWGKPAQVFLDFPFIDSGLRGYYEALGNKAPRAALSHSYETIDIPFPRIRRFAEFLGVEFELRLQHSSTSKHPRVRELRVDNKKGVKWGIETLIDEDWVIPELETVLNSPNETISRLIWGTMCKAPAHCLIARFRPNRNYDVREEPSRAVLFLKFAAWIPQKFGHFVRPCDASKDLLPSGFPFDAGCKWLSAIEFGASEQQRAQEQTIKESTAKTSGFPNAETFERAKKFAAIPKEQQERFLAEFERRRIAEFPEHVSRNPERREQLVIEQAGNAPERLVEQRTLSVSVGREAVKIKAEEYLREQYTDADGELFCQVCKAPMPFKLNDGRFYFEKVEFLHPLKQRHYQNYLALCPNHAAMFIEANASRGLLRGIFLNLRSTELVVVLAQQNMTIRFTKTHIADLNAVIKTDQKGDSEA